jgi:hypothetical protein
MNFLFPNRSYATSRRNPWWNHMYLIHELLVHYATELDATPEGVSIAARIQLAMIGQPTSYMLVTEVLHLCWQTNYITTEMLEENDGNSPPDWNSHFNRTMREFAANLNWFLVMRARYRRELREE